MLERLPATTAMEEINYKWGIMMIENSKDLLELLDILSNINTDKKAEIIDYLLPMLYNEDI